MTLFNKILITFLVLFLLSCGRKDFDNPTESTEIKSESFYGKWNCSCLKEENSYYSQYSLKISNEQFETDKSIYLNDNCNSNNLALIERPSQSTLYKQRVQKEEYLIKRIVENTFYTFFEDKGLVYLKSIGAPLPENPLNNENYKVTKRLVTNESITLKGNKVLEYCSKNRSDEVFCVTCHQLD